MEAEVQGVGADVECAYRHSWIAYVRPVVIFSIMMLASVLLTNLHWGLALGMAVAALGLFAYNVLLLRSVRLYADDTGVWVYSGILPWAKGMYGVKWRDLEDAVFFQTFTSWLCKSYTVRIGHRFTKSSEIIIPHVHRGHEAVTTINERHVAMLNTLS